MSDGIEVPLPVRLVSFFDTPALQSIMGHAKSITTQLYSSRICRILLEKAFRSRLLNGIGLNVEDELKLGLLGHRAVFSHLHRQLDEA